MPPNVKLSHGCRLAWHPNRHGSPRRQPLAQPIGSPPSSSCKPILILHPIGVDNPLLLVRWKLSRPMHAPAIAGILGRREHVSVIALGTLKLVTQAIDTTCRKLERGESNAVGLALPSLSPILVEHRKHFWHSVRRKIAPNNALNICARDRRSRLCCHRAGERPPSATATGEPSSDEAKEQRISQPPKTEAPAAVGCREWVGASGFISTDFARPAVLSTAILPGRQMPGLSSAMRAKSPE